jgi:hypothetical protein
MVYSESSLKGLMNGYEAYDKLVHKIKYINYILLLLIPLLLSLFIPINWTVSLFIGLGLGILNYHLLSKNLGSLFLSAFPVSHNNSTHSESGERTLKLTQKGFVLKYYFRTALTAILLYLIIRNPWVNPLALLIGITLILANILLTVLCSNYAGERRCIKTVQ